MRGSIRIPPTRAATASVDKPGSGMSANLLLESSGLVHHALASIPSLDAPPLPALQMQRKPGLKRSHDEIAGEEPDDRSSSLEPSLTRHAMEGPDGSPVTHDRLDRAVARIKGAAAREERRKERGRFAAGRYLTTTGPGTISGMFGQRMAQTRASDYGGHTLGSLPSYDAIRSELFASPELKILAARSIAGELPQAEIAALGLTGAQHNALTLANIVSNVSESDRNPGYAKYLRGASRAYLANPEEGLHPLDYAMNPATEHGGAGKAREFLATPEQWSESHIAAAEAMSDDSDAEADDYGPLRKRMLVPIADDADRALSRQRRRNLRKAIMRRRDREFDQGADE